MSAISKFIGVLEDSITGWEKAERIACERFDAWWALHPTARILGVTIDYRHEKGVVAIVVLHT